MDEQNVLYKSVIWQGTECKVGDKQKVIHCHVNVHYAF